jgi:hypothetical protein
MAFIYGSVAGLTFYPLQDAGHCHGINYATIMGLVDIAKDLAKHDKPSIIDALKQVYTIYKNRGEFTDPTCTPFDQDLDGFIKLFYSVIHPSELPKML